MDFGPVLGAGIQHKRNKVPGLTFQKTESSEEDEDQENNYTNTHLTLISISAQEKYKG